MKAVALLSTALAAALLIAAIAQAASLKKRIELVPAPVAGAVAATTAEPPLSPYEMAELARRVEACASRSRTD